MFYFEHSAIMKKYSSGRPAKGKQLSEPSVEYTAAVRYRNGDSELFHIKYASDLGDARNVVLDQIADVHSVVIATRKVSAKSKKSSSTDIL